MRTLLATAAALAAVAGLVPPAQAAAGRTAAAPYQISGIQGVADGSAGAQGSGSGAAAFASRKGERTLTLRVVDRTGAAVPATVKQPTGAPGQYVLLGEICGATIAPLKLALPGRPVVVAPVAGTCDGAPVLATTGEVRAEFR